MQNLSCQIDLYYSMCFCIHTMAKPSHIQYTFNIYLILNKHSDNHNCIETRSQNVYNCNFILKNSSIIQKYILIMFYIYLYTNKYFGSIKNCKQSALFHNWIFHYSFVYLTRLITRNICGIKLHLMLLILPHAYLQTYIYTNR